MIKIQRLQFNGFRTPDQIACVDFSNSPISVIYGQNGCGKTTYLRGINAFLSQDGSYLESIGAQSIVCDYFVDEELKTVSVNRVEGGYNWSAFEKSELLSTKSLSLGIERGATTQQARVDPDLLFSFFTHPKYRGFLNLRGASTGRSVQMVSEELSSFIRMRQLSSARFRRPDLDFTKNHVNLQNVKLENIQEILMEHYGEARRMATLKIQNALFDTLAVAIEQQGNNEQEVSLEDFSEDLCKSRSRLIEALVGDGGNTFKEMIIGKLKWLDDELGYEEVYGNKLLRTLLMNMMAELKVERLLLNSLNLLVEKFNSYLIDNKRLVISEERVIIETDGKELHLNELSSGERHILTFLTLVLFQGQHRDFLIIDEPEISLNITWQRELLGLFHEIIPKTQIIVASHSPALAKRNPGYLTELKTKRV